MQLGKLGVAVATDGPIGFFEHAESAALGPASAQRLASFAKRVEELGYSCLWMPEGFGRDSFVCSSWLLANTSQLRVATGIASIYSRDAMAASAAANALNEQSGGRFIMGLGVSHRRAVEDVRGHAYSQPVATMRAYLDAIDEAPYMAAAPAHKPHIVLAALRPKMLELAGQRASGALTTYVTPAHSARARGILGAGKTLCVGQKLVLETDPVAARRIARAELAIYLDLDNYLNLWRDLGFGDDDFTNGGSDRLIDSIFGWGDDVALRRSIQEHLDAGADHVCIKPIGPDNATDMRILELLAPR